MNIYHPQVNKMLSFRDGSLTIFVSVYVDLTFGINPIFILGNLMKYESEPKVRRISDTKSEDVKKSVQNHSHGNGKTVRSRKKSLSSHSRSKSNAHTKSIPKEETPTTYTSNPDGLTANKSETNRSSKHANTKIRESKASRSATTTDAASSKTGKCNWNILTFL